MGERKISSINKLEQFSHHLKCYRLKQDTHISERNGGINTSGEAGNRLQIGMGGVWNEQPNADKGRQAMQWAKCRICKKQKTT